MKSILVWLFAFILFGVSYACPVGLAPYPATIVSVYDGDTVRANIVLLGNLALLNESVRLDGIDAPEIRGEERPEGLLSRDYLRSILPEAVTLCINQQRGKYGRLIAAILVDGESINDHLVRMGYAEYVPY